MEISKDIDLKEYIVNKTNEFNQHNHGTVYRKYFHRESNLALGALVTAGIFHPVIYSDDLLVVSGIITTDIVIRAINGGPRRIAASGLVGLTRELYEKLAENKTDKSLKPYRSRIKELRENIELVEEFHRVAKQQPRDRFR